MTPSSVSQRIAAFHSSFSPEAVEPRYAFMAENAYRFFRGSCHLFYEDLSRHDAFPHRAPAVWGCGDLHLENFGSYKGTKRAVYFDQNDFDEAALLPATWEVVRMLTSIPVAFRVLLVKEADVLAWTRVFLDAYCKTLEGGKAMHVEERLARGIVKEFLQRADRKSEKDFLRKHVTKKAGGYRLLCDGKKYFPLRPEAKRSLLNYLEGWRSTQAQTIREGSRITDACRRTAGTGSVGVRRFVLLLEADRGDDRFVLLDMKEARPSALSPFNPVVQPPWKKQADRIVAVQSRSQYATTALLCSAEYDGASFTLQELQPEEDKLDFTQVVQRKKDARRVMKDMALLTASAHLRSAGRQGSAVADDLIAFGREKAWQTAVTDYAFGYAERVTADYRLFLRDFKNGFFSQRTGGSTPQAAGKNGR